MAYHLLTLFCVCLFFSLSSIFTPLQSEKTQIKSFMFYHKNTFIKTVCLYKTAKLQNSIKNKTIKNKLTGEIA